MEFRFDREHGRSFHFHRIYLETLEGILELLETRGYRVLRIHDDVRGYESIQDIRSHPGEATRQFAVVAVAEDEARNDIIELRYRKGDLLVTRSDRSGDSDEAWDTLISFLEQRHRIAEDPLLRGYLIMILGLLGALPFFATAMYEVIAWNLLVGLIILGAVAITGAVYILAVRPRQARVVYRRRRDLGFFERWGPWMMGAVFAGILSFIILIIVRALLH